MPRYLSADKSISAAQARELLFYMIRWGDHPNHELRLLPDITVEEKLKASGYPWNQVIDGLKDNPNRGIMWFENFITAGSFEITHSDGISVTSEWVIDGASTGKISVDQHSILRLDYVAQFTAACKARDAAIAASDIDEFFTMLSKGFASIESFLALRAHIYNEGKEPEDKLIDGGSRRHVSTEAKLKEWLPKMSGQSVNFGSSPGWAKFLKLRSIRDNAVIHPKVGASPNKLEELASGINDFREGIAGLMFLLHQSFRIEINRDIIRAMKYPTVRVLSK